MLCLQSYMYFRNAENLYKRTKVLLVTASAPSFWDCNVRLLLAKLGGIAMVRYPLNPHPAVESSCMLFAGC